MENYTQYDVRVVLESGEEMLFPASGFRVRTVETDEPGTMIWSSGQKVPYVRRKLTVTPPDKEAIVPMAYLQALAAEGRYPRHLWAADTSDAIRDAKGRVSAVRRLVQLQPATEAARIAAEQHVRWWVALDGPGNDDRWQEEGGPYLREEDASDYALALSKNRGSSIVVMREDEAGRHLPGYGFQSGERVSYGFTPSVSLPLPATEEQ